MNTTSHQPGPQADQLDGDNVVVVGLTAALVAVVEDMPCVLVVAQRDGGDDKVTRGLPYGPFEPVEHRTLDSGLRAWVKEQTLLQLGYVEQLYTFGDRGRHDQDPEGGRRVVSIGYLALTRQAADPRAGSTRWQSWYDFFPWEDWRDGRPEIVDNVIAPALDAWLADLKPNEQHRQRVRVGQCFGLSGANVWDEERVLERYELLYEAGLVYEWVRDRGEGKTAETKNTMGADMTLGVPMIYDHRRILATAMGRLRGKLKYRPVIFEMMPPTFTLLDLQLAVEAISGVRLHKQNFRRLVEKSGLVESTGQISAETKGRPAQLFRFRPEVLSERPAPGVRLGAPKRTNR